MKKKIINGIMMVALVAATSTSFVSCKDTNEDVRVEQAIEIAALQGRLTTLENQYGDLDGRVSAMKNRLDDVEALALDNAADIALLEVQVEEIEEDIDNLQLWLVETFAKLVTSVEISGTYNNMTGSINVPGFEPKMLIFNYGVASKDGSFPESLDAADRLEWVANEEIGAGEYNPGNAGCIYANVNRYIDDLPLLAKWQWDYIDSDLIPLVPQFDFALVNTAGEKAEGVVIGNMNIEGYPTTDVLQWGWTRADNNIFKFGVVYEGDEASNFTPAKVDLSLLKNDLKAIWADRNRWSGTSKESLGRLVADLYYNYATRDTNLKKYALKISWKDNTTYAYDKDGETIVESDEEAGLEHMVTSEAELVFAAIKPLAFTSGDALASVADSHVKGANNLIEKMEPYIDKILNKIKGQIKIKNFDESIFYDGTIAISDGTGNVPAGHYILTIPGADLDNATGLAGSADLEVDIDDIVEPIKGAYENVNDMMNDIKNLLGKINGTNIGNWMEKFTNRFNTLFANNADQMLQPTLLAINNGVVNRVSGIKSAPYVADGEVTLKPTTYTAELFAPAYAKYVGCKDIDADNFNKIIFSGAQELKFTPEAGKLYEIVYEAVDYFGNTFEHTYYIQGK